MEPFIERYILENPTVVLIVLAVIGAAALLGRRATGRAALYVAAAAAAAMAAVVLLSVLVQTDRERVAGVVEDLRQAVAAGDADAVAASLSKDFSAGGDPPMDAAGVPAAVQRVFELVTIRSVRAVVAAPRFDGDQAEIAFSLVVDAETPGAGPIRGHHSRWLLRVVREPSAPRGWAVRRIRCRQFDPFAAPPTLSDLLEGIR